MRTKSKYIKHNSRSPFQILAASKNDIESKFDFLKCSIADNILICKGIIQPTTESQKYLIRIKYNGRKSPDVHIINPIVSFNKEIHMYSDKSLCLYYPEEQPWAVSMSLSSTIIPWTAEWLIYYELYKHFGIWLGPEADHGNAEKEKK